MTVGTQNVSRETMEKLQGYVQLLTDWNASINLVSKSSLPDVWERHIVDSAQLFDLAPTNWQHWVDLGSGGGLPGLVIAILANSSQKVSLIESDTRKSLFLNTVRRELSLNVDVVTTRIEQEQSLMADVLSARALAPLAKLCGYAVRHGAPNCTSLFPKGATFQDELDVAGKNWDFDVKVHQSTTNAASRILQLHRIAPK